MASSTKFYNFKKRAIVFFFFENLKIWQKNKSTNEKNYVSIEFSRKVRRIFAIYWHYQYNCGVYFL